MAVVTLVATFITLSTGLCSLKQWRRPILQQLQKHFLRRPKFFSVNVAASCFVPIFLLRPFDYRWFLKEWGPLKRGEITSDKWERGKEREREREREREGERGIGYGSKIMSRKNFFLDFFAFINLASICCSCSCMSSCAAVAVVVVVVAAGQSLTLKSVWCNTLKTWCQHINDCPTMMGITCPVKWGRKRIISSK